LQDPEAAPPQGQAMMLFGYKWWASFSRQTIGSCYTSEHSEAPDSFEAQSLGLFSQSGGSAELGGPGILLSPVC